MAIFNEAYIEEYKALNEMHFSKKDLQDPSTIDKILKRKENFESVLGYVRWLFVALSTTSGILVTQITKKLDLKLTDRIRIGFITYSVLLLISLKMEEALKALPEKFYNQDIEKYKKQINELIEKMEKLKEKDPENAEKYQKIIDNCKEVLREFDRREATKKKEHIENEVDDLIEHYRALKKYYYKPCCLGHTGGESNYRISDIMFNIAELYKVPVKNIINNCISKMKSSDRFDYLCDPEILDLSSMFKGKKYILTSSDDESSTFIIADTKKMYYTDGYDIEETDFYKEAKNNNIDKEVLIEFDKRLGFYQFSKCPDNVKKKEFDLFK